MFVLTTRALIWMKICVGFVLCSPNLVRGSDPSVTKAVIRFSAPDLTQDSSGANPKTLYIAGKCCARIEEIRKDGLHVIVVRQPDFWILDLSAKSGIHSVNRSTDLEVHNPILGPDGPEPLFDFEYGYEMAFFERRTAKSLGTKEVRGKKCETWELESENYRLQLDVNAITKTPVELKVTKNGAIQFRIEYLQYDTDLPFDPSLFKPPDGIQISEAIQ